MCNCTKPVGVKYTDLYLKLSSNRTVYVHYCVLVFFPRTVESRLKFAHQGKKAFSARNTYEARMHITYLRVM